MINWNCEVYRVPLGTGVASEDGCYTHDYIDWFKERFVFHFERAMNLVSENILIGSMRREIRKMGYDILDVRVTDKYNFGSVKGNILVVSGEAFVRKVIDEK